ncbi:MAG: peptidoglycan DD-metalloendopeptidase family protein [Alphaproteobacteria bacterium]|nr:peptidoglycan DD-metalloendopeptidase family protein [Alphaproteobacteria bacterium]
MRFFGLFFLVLSGYALAEDVSPKLLKQLENYANTLDDLEGNLEQKKANLVQLNANLDETRTKLAHARQKMMNDVSQLDVTTREMLRIARFPWQAQMLADLGTPQVPRAGLLKQGQRALSTSLENQQKRLSELLKMEQQMNNLVAQQSETALHVQTKRDRIRALYQKQLERLSKQDTSLAKKLKTALPKAQKVDVTPSEKQNLVALPHGKPVEGFITQPFGEQDGTTILATPGTTVTALNGGAILFSGPFRDYGWLVIVGSSEHEHDIYGGLDYPSVRVGQRIAAGDALGALPNTEKPYLYYEARRNDQPVAPQF